MIVMSHDQVGEITHLIKWIKPRIANDNDNDLQ